MPVAPQPVAAPLLVVAAPLQEVAVPLQTEVAPHQMVGGILQAGAALPWVVAACLQEAIQGSPSV